MGLGKSNNHLTQAHQSVTYCCCLENYKQMKKINSKTVTFSLLQKKNLTNSKTAASLSYCFFGFLSFCGEDFLCLHMVVFSYQLIP